MKRQEACSQTILTFVHWRLEGVRSTGWSTSSMERPGNDVLPGVGGRCTDWGRAGGRARGATKDGSIGLSEPNRRLLTCSILDRLGGVGSPDVSMDTGERGGMVNKALTTVGLGMVEDWSTVTDTSLRRLILAFSRAEVTATTGSVSLAWVGGAGAGTGSAYTA